MGKMKTKRIMKTSSMRVSNPRGFTTDRATDSCCSYAAILPHGICPHGYYCGLRRLLAPANIYYILYCKFVYCIVHQFVTRLVSCLTPWVCNVVAIVVTPRKGGLGEYILVCFESAWHGLLSSPPPPPAEEAIIAFLDQNDAEAQEETRFVIPAGTDFSAVDDDDVFDGFTRRRRRRPRQKSLSPPG